MEIMENLWQVGGAEFTSVEDAAIYLIRFGEKTALIDALMRIGQMVIDFPEIAELDINPFMLYSDGQGGIAIDMRLILEVKEHRAASVHNGSSL